MSIRDTDEYKNMDLYTACMIAEGAGDELNTEVEMAAAWQYLYDQEAYTWLQGWYGRTMQNLLEEGLIEA